MRALGLLCLALVGCGGSHTTTLLVDVSNGDKDAPAAVTVSVFNDFGLLGRSRMANPALPGQLTVLGLPDSVQSVRVTAVGDDPRSLDGVRFDIAPHAQMTQKLVLRAANSDDDGDGVPDVIDDCPDVADPDQRNTDGLGRGDACGGGVVLGDDSGVVLPGEDGGVADMATFPGQDLAHQPGEDLAHTAPEDLAHAIVDMAKGNTGPDLATAPSTDMANIPIFSDNFENGLTSPWTLEQATGSLNQSPNQHHSRFASLRVQENALSAGSHSRVDLVESVAVPSPDAWIRVFAYVPGGADPTAVAVLSLEQPGSSGKSFRLQLAKGSFATSNSVTTPTTNLSATVPTYPTDQWFCIEWHVHMATNGYAKAYLNGLEVGALTVVQNTLPSPGFGQIALGLIADPTSNTTARDYYFDDFAVDANPIGCDK